jgi:hypothetical protein
MTVEVILFVMLGASAPQAGSNIPATTTAAPAVASDLPPEAKPHNDRGVALILAGDLTTGIAELERAYAAMPDPLKYRVGRGKVLGSLRGALQRRYDMTGEPGPLCRMRELLRQHRAALLAALGPAGRAEDVAGTDAALQKIDETLGGRSCGEPLRPQTSPRPPQPREGPEVPRPGLRIAGGALMGVGLASLGVMTFGLVAMTDHRSKLQSLTATVEAAGRPATAEQMAEATARHARAEDRRTLAIATGVVGGVAVIVGTALHLAGRRQVHAKASVLPSLGPGFVGLAGRLAF